MIRKFIKYGLLVFGWLFIVIIALIVLALGAIQTRIFKDKLVSFIEGKAGNYINGSLTIGRIEGDFFTHITLRDILLANERDTIGYIEEISAGYNLMNLLRWEISVNRVKISRPYFYFEQINDSTWNVQQILKPLEKAEDTVTVKGKAYDIDLSSLSISDGEFKIHSPDTIIPKRIYNLNTQLSFKSSEDQQEAVLENLSFVTDSPDQELRKLTLKFARSPEMITVTDLSLQTALNQIEGKVTYMNDKKEKSVAVLQTTPLQLDEFKYYLSGFKTGAKPVLKLEASMQNDSVRAVLEMSDKDQLIHLDLLSSNLYIWLMEKGDSLLNYNVAGNLENIDPVHWLGIQDLKYIINGKITAEGNGTDPETAIANLTGNFDDLVVEGRKVGHLHLDVDYNRGDLEGSAEGNGDFGEFDLTTDIRDLLKVPVYNLNLIARNLDISKLGGPDTIPTAINMSARISGKGIEPKTLSAKADIVFSGSQIQEIRVDTMIAFIQYSRENLIIDSMRLNTQSLALEVQGDYSLKSNSDLLLTADFTGLDEFASFIPVTDFQTSGHLEARLLGTIDSLNIDADLELPQIQYGDYSTGQVLVSAQAGITPSDTVVIARLLAYNISSGEFLIDSASVNLEAAGDSAFIDGHLVNKDLDTQFKTNLLLGATTKINLTEWEIDYKDQNWKLGEPPAVIEIGPKSYKVDNFNLTSTAGDSVQYISAQGVINREGAEDFTLSIKNIDLKKLAELSTQDLPATGTIDFNLSVNGTAASPILKGDFVINDAVLNEYPFTEFLGTFDYASDKMDLEMRIVPRDSGKFEITGTMPLHLKLDSMNFRFDKKDPIDVLLLIEKFPLAAIRTVDMSQQITGYIEGEVQVGGSVESPDLKGNMHLENASVKVPQYGVDYRNILVNMNFERDKVMLDTIQIITDKGKMTGTGELNFSSDFYKGNISNSLIELNFDGFKPLDHRQLNMEVSGKTSLGGTSGNVTFDGDIEVTKGEVYLPALFNLIGKVYTPEIPKPILIKAMDTTAIFEDTLVFEEKIDTMKSDTTRLDYFKNLKGKLRFKIPKNTWVKNESMYIEIRGDLELIKEQQFFELFGSVDVVRGQYELLGRKFVIDDGSINFQGGEEMAPVMNIKASYSFRNTQRIKQELTVNVQGTADSLGVNFTLDGNSITEGDAFSYILFGRSLNELTLDQQEGMSGGRNSMAEQVAASLVSSQLTKFIGSKLNVDYLEIKSEGGFENAALVVGKYITNDLFASYEQRFGQTDEKGLATYELNLEYELFKFLFLRMNNSSIDNGFDVIFKFEGK